MLAESTVIARKGLENAEVRNTIVFVDQTMEQEYA